MQQFFSKAMSFGPQIVTPMNPLATGEINVPYVPVTLMGTAGSPPYTWAFIQGGLVTGLTLSSGGVVSGTPTSVGSSFGQVQITDSLGAKSNSAPCSLTTLNAPSFVTASPLPSATQGVAYSTTITATGGLAPYTWALISGTLATGLSFSNGVISGTPTVAEVDSITVQVTDAFGAIVSKVFGLTVATSLAITTSTPLPVGVANTAYSATLAASGGTLPYTWTLVSGTLDTGLSLSSAGVISGTPLNVETDTITIRVTDNVGSIANKTFTLTVSATAPSSTMQMGANINAGGGTAFSYESFPIFKNRVREGRGFTDPNTGSGQVALSAAGWPTVDFACFLWEGTQIPSWLTASSTTPFKCGFIGAGTPQSFFGSTVSNIGSSGAYTTFDLVMSSQGGFKVTGGAGATNVYAYLPGYNLGAIDDVTNANAFTTEAIAFYGQFSHLRVMKAVGVEWNAELATAANRRTPANTQAAQSGFGATVVTLTSAPLATATSASLTAGWPLHSGTFAIPFHSTSPTIQGRVCTMTAGSPNFFWTDALTANCDTTGLAKIGIENYPVEWWISLANACNIGVWICTPVIEDGVDYAAGSWSQAVLDYIGTHWTSTGTVYFEMVNENWNFGMYQSPWALNGIAAVKGYYAAAGNDVTSYYAYRLHAFANLARARIPTMFGTKVKQISAWQTLPGGIFYMRRIMNQLGLLTATPKSDVQMLAIAPYFHPTLGNADSVATIQATALAKAQIQSLTAWCENNCILAAHYGMDFGTYEDGGDWGNAVYNTVTNLPAAILNSGMQPAVTAHYQLNGDCGSKVNTHFAIGVSATASLGYELTNVYAAPLVTSQLSAIQSFFSGFTPTRNVVSASGSIVNGVNFADNNSTILNQQACFALVNGGNFAPYGQNGRVPFVIWCTDPRANSGAVTYSLRATFSAVAGTPTTDVEIGDPTRGFTTIATGVSVANGVVTLGNITLVKGWNYVLLGRNGTQGTIAQNLITQLQFV